MEKQPHSIALNAFRNTSNYAGKGIFKPGIESMQSMLWSLSGSKSDFDEE